MSQNRNVTGAPAPNSAATPSGVVAAPSTTSPASPSNWRTSGESRTSDEDESALRCGQSEYRTAARHLDATTIIALHVGIERREDTEGIELDSQAHFPVRRLPYQPEARARQGPPPQQPGTRVPPHRESQKPAEPAAARMGPHTNAPAVPARPSAHATTIPTIFSARCGRRREASRTTPIAHDSARHGREQRGTGLTPPSQAIPRRARTRSSQEATSPADQLQQQPDPARRLQSPLLQSPMQRTNPTPRRRAQPQGRSPADSRPGPQ